MLLEQLSAVVTSMHDRFKNILNHFNVKLFELSVIISVYVSTERVNSNCKYLRKVHMNVKRPASKL